MSDLANELAFVTGASRGIGRAIALELGRRGARVVGTATTQAGAQSITAALAGSGPALVEVMIDRREGVARHRDYWSRVAAAPGA